MKFSSPAFKGDLIFLFLEYSYFDNSGVTDDDVDRETELSCWTTVEERLSSATGANPESEFSENCFDDPNDLKVKTVPSLLFAE